MASGVAMHAFNWNAFQTLVTQSVPKLAETVVEVMREAGMDEELPDLFEADFDPVEKVQSVLASHDWYADEHGLDEETIDDMVHRIFDEELPELEIETIGCGVNFGLLRAVTGEFKVNQDPSIRIPFIPTDKKPEECSQYETNWLGGRFFRGFDQNGQPVPCQETVRDDDRPLYSLHTPEQVQQMYKEVIALEEESENWADDDIAHCFMSDFLEPLEVAANNNLAIFAMSDC